MSAEPEISRILESYFQASGSLQRRTTFSQNNWSGGSEAYVNRDYQRAIDEFQKGDHSKMMYNTGMAYLNMSEYEKAKEAFSRALGKDRFFALGWFQRGYCDYVAGDYPAAFQDFVMAKKLLHDNTFIDYGKIGCKFELRKAEILFNIALVHLQLGNLDEAAKTISEGKAIPDKQNKVDFEALRAKGSCVPFYSPTEIFHPPILAKAAKQRANTNPDFKNSPAIKDELADSLRQKLKRLEEADQTQIYQVLSTIKRAYGDGIMALKNVPDLGGKEDFVVKQLIDLRDILYNKKIGKTLQRHARELYRSFDKRADKWKLWCDMFSEYSANGREEELVTEFLRSDVIRASLLSICKHPSDDTEDLLLLHIFSFLLLPTLKPENVLDYIAALSACTDKNPELTKLVVDSVLNLENLIPTVNGTETLAIFPSFFASLELHEKAQQCSKMNTSSKILHSTEEAVHKLVQDYSEKNDKASTELAEKSKIADEKISQLDAEIEELRSKLATQANEIQTTTSALSAKRVQKKAKLDKLELVRQDRADYLKIRAEEEAKLDEKFALTRVKIETFKKSVSALAVFDKNLRVTIAKLVHKFIPTLSNLIHGQETNLQYLNTKFSNYQTSMNEFLSEADIYAKLRAAFEQCERHFHVLARNTYILAQSADILAGVICAPEWDAERAQVQQAHDRIAALGEKEREMRAQFNIKGGGN